MLVYQRVMFCHVSIIASECYIIVPSFLARVSIMCPSCSHWFPIFRIFSTMRPSMFNHDPSLSIIFYIIFHHVNVLSTMSLCPISLNQNSIIFPSLSHQFSSMFHPFPTSAPALWRASQRPRPSLWRMRPESEHPWCSVGNGGINGLL